MSQPYGIVHVPLIARIERSRRNHDQVVAFIGNQLCFFERGPQTPTAGRLGEDVEVMITRPAHPKHPINHPRAGCTNYQAVSGLMIEIVDHDRHLLAAIDGFECAGTMCRTTATGILTDGSREFTSKEVYSPSNKQHLWLTPGRSRIRETSNINRRSMADLKPRYPTNVWIERAIFEEKCGCGVRVAGLTRIEDLDCAHLLTARQKIAA